MTRYQLDKIAYVLPDGRRIDVAWDLCRGHSFIDYTLADGRIVTAIIAGRQR